MLPRHLENMHTNTDSVNEGLQKAETNEDETEKD